MRGKSHLRFRRVGEPFRVERHYRIAPAPVTVIGIFSVIIWSYDVPLWAGPLPLDGGETAIEQG